jgi:hypothetical protein
MARKAEETMKQSSDNFAIEKAVGSATGVYSAARSQATNISSFCREYLRVTPFEDNPHRLNREEMPKINKAKKSTNE